MLTSAYSNIMAQYHRRWYSFCRRDMMPRYSVLMYLQGAGVSVTDKTTRGRLQRHRRTNCFHWERTGSRGMAGSERTCCLSREWESPDYEPALPVSEKSNPLTRDIDRASANGIVRMLQACDAQMFQEETEEETYQRLFGDQLVKTVMEVAQRVELILKDPQGSLVVLSGCGTSGRMAFLMASSFNRELQRLSRSLVYSYIVAGGDRALLSSQEAPEDDPMMGMLSLKKVCEGKKRVLFIGISCGLSAPFVAAQLDFCLQHPEIYTPVLLGFNPVHQAKDEPTPGCTFTFRSVVERMQDLVKTQEAFLINPAVGPEAISGSSRMKGGSATKILLDVILSAAHAATFTNTPITHKGIVQHMRTYEETVEVTYAQSEGISALVEAAGLSLRCAGRVCYLGWGSLAVLGLIDASECNPTFGADYEDIRGFVSGGFRQLHNNEGSLTSLGRQFCISHQDFQRLVLPQLSDRDTVLLLYAHCDDVSDVVKVAQTVRGRTSNLHAVYHHTDGDTAAAGHQDDINKLCLSTLKLTWPPSASASLVHMRFAELQTKSTHRTEGVSPQCSNTDLHRLLVLMVFWVVLYFTRTPNYPSLSSLQQWELSTKLVLNAVSTGAHILKGKIYQNYMIDLQVTNSKLYRRATRLLQKLSGQLESKCEEFLLRAIHRADELTADITSSDITTRTNAARDRSTVVPLALVCLLTGCSVSEAESRLEQQPIIRETVEACLA